ncbi:MAG TPA: GH116 family glycosyl hydrolase [Candidatus Didemnitutus sp.]
MNDETRHTAPIRNPDRREFLKLSALAAAAVGTLGAAASAKGGSETPSSPAAQSDGNRRPYNSDYRGEHLSRVAFPMGGIGAGTICLEGHGGLSHFSVMNHPDVFNDPGVFAAISVRGAAPVARVLEGPPPSWKYFGGPGNSSGDGKAGLGLPRFQQAVFQARFPFAEVALHDPAMPLTVAVTGWSPFEPGDADHACLPVAGLEYRFTNPSSAPIEAVFSFHARHFLAQEKTPGDVRVHPGGFVLHAGAPAETPWLEGDLAVFTDDPGVKVNHAWFRGGWWDWLAMVWKDIADGACYDRAPVATGGAVPGATLFVPFQLAPGESRTVGVRLAWHAPHTNIHEGEDLPNGGSGPRETYRPWYAGRFSDVAAVAQYWAANYQTLRGAADRFATCFADSTLPPEVREAVAANLSILKSPTILRQSDGRLWGWEGSADTHGQGDLCTHVWNYAQAIPHLFPSLERTLRETELGPSQNPDGRQTFRSALPIRPIVHHEYDATDGQLGGIMKVHREWRIGGNTDWLRALWPKLKISLDYCIVTWDPRQTGCPEEPQHNTYDIEFWGPNGMGASCYLGALQAAIRMGRALGENVGTYEKLYDAGIARTESELFDGEYFIQKTRWKDLRAEFPGQPTTWTGEPFSPEAMALLEKEGPNYQYGAGCLSDGVIGSWFAMVCGVGQVLDREKVRSHLRAVHRHNLKHDLTGHVNPDRPAYASSTDGGLLLCSWPKGGRASLPFVYSDEVWTGIEYQVASHLMLMGRVAEGLEIVRACRDRYDGRVRNPFNEYEWGSWYARAMASYALLQGLSGARYDAVDRVLYLEPNIPGDFRCFLATATGYGTVGVRQGKPFFDVVAGKVDVQRVEYRATA